MIRWPCIFFEGFECAFPFLGAIWQANNSLERTQPQRDFMYGIGMLRRSARGR